MAEDVYMGDDPNELPEEEREEIGREILRGDWDGGSEGWFDSPQLDGIPAFPENPEDY